MKTKKLIYIFFTGYLAVLSSSCQKFLDKKPSTGLIVPATLNDFIRLMDDYGSMNVSPILSEISADNFYLATKSAWQGLPFITQRNGYIFKADFEQGNSTMDDWNYPYRQVFVANVVLEGIKNTNRDDANASEWDYVKGWALFLRSYAFFNLAQLFSPVYDPSTSGSSLGIPLRLLPGVDEKYQRSSLEETYQQILTDMNASCQLFAPGLPTKNRNRPSKEASYAALARIYLAMGNYELALENAKQGLLMYDELLDYEELSKQPTPYLVDINHRECIWQNRLGNSDLIFYRDISPNTLIDSVLYNSYSLNDLRRSFYFMPSSLYPGKGIINRSYTGGTTPFSGLAVDELYLIRAECLIRTSKVKEGLDVLNKLLITRYAIASFQPYQTSDLEDALEIVLKERRKELVFRGLRWQDLRRLNREGFNITVRRNLDRISYILPPNSNLYILPIPPEEIRLNNLTQNQRN